MILSSPFSRQSRGHQTWSNSDGAANSSPAPKSSGFASFAGHRKPQLTLTLPATTHSRVPQPPLHQAPSGRLGSATPQNGLPQQGQYLQHQILQPGQPHKQQANSNFRSHTLNRLDMLRARQRQQHEQQQQIKRNLSALGHYSSASLTRPQGAIPATTMPTNYQMRSGTHLDDLYYKQPQQQQWPVSVALKEVYSSPAKKSYPSQALHPIYAPVSIASPNEYSNGTNYTSAMTGNFRRGNSANVSDELRSSSGSAATRSGRESALGALWERIGTLRRRAKWSSGSSRSSNSTSKSSKHQHQTGSLQRLPKNSLSRQHQSQTAPPLPANDPPGPPEQVALVDPEIYAAGKRELGAEEIYAEGSRAIDGNSQRRMLEHQIDENLMQEGETKTIIERESQQRPDYKLLVCILRNWINDELALDRIIVKDLQEDLYDGQIIGRLFEKLHGVKLDLVEVTQNEHTQRHKLCLVLEAINRVFAIQARWARIRWTVDGIHGKNLVEIIYLITTLALYYRAPIKLPENVRVRVTVVQKLNNQLIKRSHEAQLTDSSYGARQVGGHVVPYSTETLDRNVTGRGRNLQLNRIPLFPKRDVFDTLVESASPEKLGAVTKSLVNFVNRHLNKINMTCQSSKLASPAFGATSTQDQLDPSQFSDGLLLVFLISSLEDYFVPLGNLFTAEPEKSRRANEQQHPLESTTLEQDSNNNLVAVNIKTNSNSNIHETALEPTSYINTQPIHKLHNVNVAFQLMEEAGIDVRSRGVRAEDIVNGDLKSLLRVLYALFSRYKHL